MWRTVTISGLVGAVLVGMVLALAGLCGRAAADAGSAACASPSCHGGPVARADSAVARQDEYVVWRTRDRHAHAGAVLDDERSHRIATALGLDRTAASSARCLVCHAPAVLSAPPSQAAAVRRDGVSCESCHGSAEGWIARHTERGWSHAGSVARGLTDLRDPAVAAERCLDCHVGRGTQTVDHDLLAAGHPLLRFELDTYATAQPAHWNAHDGNAAWFDGRAWIVGQARTLARVAEEACRAGGAGGWPEFARYECAGCHHEINRDPEWPLAGGGEHPGLDTWFAAGVAPAVERLVPAYVPALRDGVARLAMSAADDAAGAAAGPAAQSLLAVAQALEHAARRPIPAAVLHAIAARLADATPTGFRAAQQIAWGLDALAVAGGDAAESAPRRAAIGRLFAPLQRLGGYDPTTFAAALAGVRAGGR